MLKKNIRAMILITSFTVLFSMLLNIASLAADEKVIASKDLVSAAQCAKDGILNEKNLRLLYGDSSNVRYVSGNESGNNDSFANANAITIGTEYADESHMFGKISSTDTTDYFKFTPHSHGRIYVILMSPTGYSYNLSLYNGNQTSLSGTSDDFSTSVITRSFMATNGTINSSVNPTYYIKVTSSSGYSSSNYRIIIFYALNYENLGWMYPIEEGNLNVSSPVGYRASLGDYHIGIDLPGNNSNTIVSMCKGTIKIAYNDAVYGMGNVVGVLSDDKDEYTDKKYYIRYMHLSSIASGINPTTGNGTQRIDKGATIGKMGTTGYSTGIHLHVEANAYELESNIASSNNIKYVINLVDVFAHEVDFKGYVYDETMYVN